MTETPPLEKKTSILPVIAREVTKTAKNILTQTSAHVSTLPASLKGESRKEWKNCVSNQINQPLLVFKPTTLKELRDIITEAGNRKCKVKAIGSGHSFADIVTTTDFLVETHGLKKELDLEKDLLVDSLNTENLVNLECGILIKDLNDLLDSKALALPNMGGYTGQTIAGVISTATHGSGIQFGPVADCVLSLTLVTEGGITYRIEPTKGITNPEKFRAAHPDIILKQDDEWFYAAVVSMGCMGIVYSVILQVAKKFWLEEIRTISTWDIVKQDLLTGNVLRDNQHYEVLVNPYIVNGKHTCVVTRRNPIDQPDKPDYKRAHRNPLEVFLSTYRFVIFLFNRFLPLIFKYLPEVTPTLLDNSMKSLKDDSYVAPSYKVFDIGSPNYIGAYSSEIGFPMSTYIDAVEEMFELADKLRVIGRAYSTCPFSLRFVKTSPAFVAMMNGRDTCMIEMPIVKGTHAGFDILKQYEQAMYKFGGRPHWGQIHFFTGNNGFIKTMYPELEKWLRVYRLLCKQGTFQNSTTERCGFAEYSFGDVG